MKLQNGKNDKAREQEQGGSVTSPVFKAIIKNID